MSESNEQGGAALLSAVERILASDDALLETARACEREAAARPGLDEAGRRLAASDAAIRKHGNLAALSGGLTALPALAPGLGSLIALTGGALVDMAALLKLEMALVLSAIHGYDIRRPEERRLAMLLAAAGVHDAKSGGSLLGDLAAAESVAVWNYAPREIAKLLATAFAKLAILLASRSLAVALPLVGIAVGSGMNKALTERVGARLVDELRRRRLERPPVPRGAEEEIVDAKVTSPAGAGAS